MGLGPAAVKLYLELWQCNLLANVESVVDMESQELHLTKNTFKELADAAGVPGYDEESFSNLDKWPGQPRCSSRYFYELLGAKIYLHRHERDARRGAERLVFAGALRHGCRPLLQRPRI